MLELNSKKEDGHTSGSPVKFSLALAGGLLFIVLGLNFLNSPEIPVTAEQFQGFSTEGRLKHITITPFGLNCQLKEPVQLTHEDREVTTQAIVLQGNQEIPPEQVSYWRSQGITVGYEDSEDITSKELAGVGFVAGLFGLGLWHLWSQVQKDRKGIGSPRRRLQELEKEFREGRISLEDYEKAREALWAEM